jgi:hypothetical protein
VAIDFSGRIFGVWAPAVLAQARRRRNVSRRERFDRQNVSRASGASFASLRCDEKHCRLARVVASARIPNNQ